jgi:2-hydroxychromene-2-carboxylate isomerase
VKHITFYFDFISPYAYLAFERLPQALQGVSYQVTYKPVLFAALLGHYGQLGPAEIAPKRIWTYRQVLWQARAQGTSLQLPASHPFNPIGLLRLALACGHGGACNRFVAETIFRHVWCGGQEAADAARLAALTAQLKPARQASDAGVKAELKANTDAAIAAGVFGVPSMVIASTGTAPTGDVFWGLDALPMLRQALDGEAGFSVSDWRAAEGLPLGATRNPHDKKIAKGSY